MNCLQPTKKLPTPIRREPLNLVTAYATCDLQTPAAHPLPKAPTCLQHSLGSPSPDSPPMPSESASSAPTSPPRHRDAQTAFHRLAWHPATTARSHSPMTSQTHSRS